MNSYIIPPRLRQSDYAKGVITQDEYLKIAVANDANIASARKAIKLGQVEQLTPIQTATPDELLADMSKQESDAISNLQKLGFRGQESQEIVAELINEPDVLLMFNINYPAIETDVKKRFNPKLLTKTFFLEYLKEYNENIKASKGLDVNSSASIRKPINALINTVEEVKKIIPSKDQLTTLLRNVNKISLNTNQKLLLQPIIDRIDDLLLALPSDIDYKKIERMNDVDRLKIIQELQDITANLPSREEFENASKLIISGNIEGINKLQDIAESIDNNVIPNLKNVTKTEIESKQVESIPMEATPVKSTPIPVKAMKEVTNLNDWKRLSAKDKQVFIKSIGEDQNIVLKSNPKIKYKLSELTSKLKWDTTNADDIVAKWLTQKPSSMEQQIGRGFMKKNNLNKIKLGKGIAVEQQPTYRQFGKYAIHMPQLLDQDILNVKYRSLGGLPSYKPMAVSDRFKYFIIEILDGQKPKNTEYLQIEPEERKVFEKLAIGAGIWSGLGLKKTILDDEEEDLKRFEILRGIYEAGNNNAQIIKELRKLVTKFINNGRIKKNVGFDLLMELSTV